MENFRKEWGKPQKAKKKNIKRKKGPPHRIKVAKGPHVVKKASHNTEIKVGKGPHMMEK